MNFLSLQEVQGPHHQLLSRDMAWAVSSVDHVDRAAGGEKEIHFEMGRGNPGDGKFPLLLVMM